MSFRQFGGLNYAPKHNIVSSNYNTANNLQVTQAIGQPNSYINFLSDISGNITIYGDVDISGNLIVNENIGISGNAFVDGTLDVSNNVTFQENLSVYGTSYMKGITGATGSFTYLSASKEISANGGITGPTGSFNYVNIYDELNVEGTANFYTSPNYIGVVDLSGNPSPNPLGQQFITKQYADNTYTTSGNILGSNNIWSGTNTFNNTVYANSGITGATGSFQDLYCSGKGVFKNDISVNSINIGIGSGNNTSNTVVGYSSFSNNTTGTFNTSIGNISLLNNTSGFSNIAVGAISMSANTTGNNNTGIGFRALQSNLTGNNNTGIGNFSLYSNTTGNNNTGIGTNALSNNQTGQYNTAIGYASGTNGANYNNSTSIGAFSQTTSSNQIMLGGPNSNDNNIFPQVVAPGGITGPTGSFQDLFTANVIKAQGGITGATGSFSYLNSNNLSIYGDGTNGYIRPNNSGSSLYLGSNNISQMSINQSGDVYINNSLYLIGTFSQFVIDNGVNTHLGIFGDGNNNYIQSSYNNTTSVFTKPLLITPYATDDSTLFIDVQNKKVGVATGNVAPQYTLDVSGNINFTGLLYQNDVPFSSGSQWNNASGNAIYYNAGTVGIGTSNPSTSYSLDVSGNANVSGNLQINTNLQIQNDGTTGYIHMNNAGSNLYIGSNNQDNIKINTSLGISLESTVTSNNFNLQINDIDTTNPNSIGFILNGIFNQYNSLISGGESVIMAKTYNNISSNSSSLVLTTHVTNMCSGVKINATNVLMGAGGTSSTPSYYFMSDASNNNYAQNIINGGFCWINSFLRVGGTGGANPQNFLYFDNSSNLFGFGSNISVGSGLDISSNWYIDSNNGNYTGNNFYGNNFIQPSDYRIKDNVQILDTTYNVDNLKPVTYMNKKTQKKDIGLIAHELQEYFPELVNGEKDGKEMQSVNYIGLIPILIKEMQELKKEIKLLKENV